MILYFYLSVFQSNKSSPLQLLKGDSGTTPQPLQFLEYHYQLMELYIVFLFVEGTVLSHGLIILISLAVVFFLHWPVVLVFDCISAFWQKKKKKKLFWAYQVHFTQAWAWPLPRSYRDCSWCAGVLIAIGISLFHGHFSERK